MDHIIGVAIKHFGLVLSFFIICSYLYTNHGNEVYFVVIVFIVLSMIVNWLIEKFAWWSYPSTRDNQLGEILYAGLFGANALISITYFYKIVTDVTPDVKMHHLKPNC